MFGIKCNKNTKWEEAKQKAIKAASYEVMAIHYIHIVYWK